MDFLMDTHTLIWFIEASSKIPHNVREMLTQPDVTVYLSSVSLWEIAIKSSLGKLDLKASFNKLLLDLYNTDIAILQIEDEYLKILHKLPWIHRDPFDRLIISTALSEGLTIVTADEAIQKYDVAWAWNAK